MAYTYLKTEVKEISFAEFEAVQNALVEAKKNNQKWIVQALQKVFDDIKLGVVSVRDVH